MTSVSAQNLQSVEEKARTLLEVLEKQLNLILTRRRNFSGSRLCRDSGDFDELPSFNDIYTAAYHLCLIKHSGIVYETARTMLEEHIKGRMHSRLVLAERLEEFAGTWADLRDVGSEFDATLMYLTKRSDFGAQSPINFRKISVVSFSDMLTKSGLRDIVLEKVMKMVHWPEQSVTAFTGGLNDKTKADMDEFLKFLLDSEDSRQKICAIEEKECMQDVNKWLVSARQLKGEQNFEKYIKLVEQNTRKLLGKIDSLFFREQICYLSQKVKNVVVFSHLREGGFLSETKERLRQFLLHCYAPFFGCFEEVSAGAAIDEAFSPICTSLCNVLADIFKNDCEFIDGKLESVRKSNDSDDNLLADLVKISRLVNICEGIHCSHAEPENFKSIFANNFREFLQEELNEMFRLLDGRAGRCIATALHQELKATSAAIPYNVDLLLHLLTTQIANFADFEIPYLELLSKRLLTNSFDTDIEKHVCKVLNKSLPQEGSSFIHRCRVMIGDEIATRMFVECREIPGMFGSLQVDLHCLSPGIWPARFQRSLADVENLRLPEKCARAWAVIKGSYKCAFPDKTLQLDPRASKCSVQVNIPSGLSRYSSFQIQCNTIEMALLMALNDQDDIEVEDLAKSVGVSEVEIGKALSNLTKCQRQFVKVVDSRVSIDMRTLQAPKHVLQGVGK